jgi:cytochrome P450
MEDLNALPYLDSVVRETLRIHPPVSNVTRSAKDDGIIPVGEPYVDRWGNTQHTIRYVHFRYSFALLLTPYRVTKGDAIVVPVQVMARSKRIWGEDAHEFR